VNRLQMVLASILAVSTILTGCGRVRYPTYYTLNFPPAPDPRSAAGVRASVAIREFQAPSYLRQGLIVYRPIPEEVGFYEYARWAVDPRLLVTNTVIDRVRAGGRFSMVSMYDGRPDVDYILSGRLSKLEEVDYEGGIKVEIAISAQMIRVSNGSGIWSNAVSEVADVNERSVPAVVAEMSHATDRAVQKLLASLAISGTDSPGTAQ
jgi:ABC-type uncharacterized transport system auxiliary subunit